MAKKRVRKVNVEEGTEIAEEVVLAPPPAPKKAAKKMSHLERNTKQFRKS